MQLYEAAPGSRKQQMDILLLLELYLQNRKRDTERKGDDVISFREKTRPGCT
jgi:hypothetical protein